MPNHQGEGLPLCICDDAVTDPAVRSLFHAWDLNEPRVGLRELTTNASHHYAAYPIRVTTMDSSRETSTCSPMPLRLASRKAAKAPTAA